MFTSDDDNEINKIIRVLNKTMKDGMFALFSKTNSTCVPGTWLISSRLESGNKILR